MTIPQIPQTLPPFIELITSKVTPNYKPAVACAAFAPLTTYMDGLQFRYIDNTLREATFMNVLIATTGAGKNCVEEPIRHLLAPVLESDAQNRQREDDWKSECEATSANARRPQRPKGLTIQCVASDMTYAAWVKRLSEANGKYLYTNVSEIDDLMRLRTSTGRSAVYEMILAAFDNAECGQERVGTASISARPRVRWAFNASTTTQKGRRFFHGQTTTGALSRVSLSTIEVDEFAEIPIYGDYDEAFDTQLLGYIERLRQTPRGEVLCPEAREFIRGLVTETRENAAASRDRAYFELSKRAAVIAYLKAMTLYLLEGEWSTLIADFVQWSYEYDLWCKMQFFGKEASREFDNEALDNVALPSSVVKLSELPQRFTREDYLALRTAKGLSLKGDTTGTLRSWKARRLIMQIDDTTYEKLER